MKFELVNEFGGVLNPERKYKMNNIENLEPLTIEYSWSCTTLEDGTEVYNCIDGREVKYSPERKHTYHIIDRDKIRKKDSIERLEDYKYFKVINKNPLI